MNIVVLISGNGSNLQAIIDACKTNKIKGTVRAVFSNKADAFGLERARQAGIATHTLITSAFDSREAYDQELIHEIDMYAPDVVVLAGFMRILSPAFVSHYAAFAEHSPFSAAEISWITHPSSGAGKWR